MSSDKWSLLDELQRMAESYIHQQKPPSSISELFDLFEKAVPPAHRKGWSDFTDAPRAATPPPPAPKEETPVPRSIMQQRRELYVCPAPDCGKSVSGTLTLQATPDQPDVPTNSQGTVNITMRVVGMRADPHDCLSKAMRTARDNGGCFTP